MNMIDASEDIVVEVSVVSHYSLKLYAMWGRPLYKLSCNLKNSDSITVALYPEI
jgi:hypothetical protein